MCVCCAHTPFGPVKLVASVIRRDIKFKSYQFDITWGNTLPKSSRCTRIARLGQHMSPCIYFFTVKVLKSIYRWFIMLPPWDRGKERDRQSEIEMAFASGIAACNTVGRWWMPPCIVGLSVSDQNSFRAIQLKVKWKICNLCDSSVHPLSHHPISQGFFFGSPLYGASLIWRQNLQMDCIPMHKWHREFGQLIDRDKKGKKYISAAHLECNEEYLITNIFRERRFNYWFHCLYFISTYTVQTKPIK